MKTTPSANQSRFFLTIKGCPSDINVDAFEGERLGLSEDYEFALYVRAKETIDPEKCNDKPAVLRLESPDGPSLFHGVIMEQQGPSITPDADYFGYQLLLCSPLSRLRHTTYNRVYLRKNVKELVGAHLKNAGFYESNYSFRLRDDYPQLEYIVQYNETDYGFLIRQLDHFGLFYCFEQGAQDFKLVITDDIRLLNSVAQRSLDFQQPTGANPATETAFGISTKSRVLAEGVLLRDYGDQHPRQALTLKSKPQRKKVMSGKNTDYRYGEGYSTRGEGEQLLQARQEALDWQRFQIELETNCLGLYPGQCIQLKNCPLARYDAEYRIISIEQAGDQRDGKKAMTHNLLKLNKQYLTYKNKLKLIPANVAYRHPVNVAKKFQGLQSARVESPGGEYAYLDGQGRYHIRLPFDLSSTGRGHGSHPVRLMQPYSGIGFGSHWPLHDNTDVLVCHVNGDCNRPLLMGVLPNPSCPSPVIANNKTQNILRTSGGNELLMEDQKDAECIALFTREKQNSLCLDARKNKNKIRLATEKGKMTILAKKALHHKSGDTHSHRVGEDHKITVENAIRLSTQTQDITYQAQTDIQLKAGNAFSISTEKADITHTSGQSTIVKTKGSAKFLSKDGAITICTDQGSQSFKVGQGATITTQGQADIVLAQSGAQLTIRKDGSLQIRANLIQIKGQKSDIQGIEQYI